jgi:integrase
VLPGPVEDAVEGRGIKTWAGRVVDGDVRRRRRYRREPGGDRLPPVRLPAADKGRAEEPEPVAVTAAEVRKLLLVVRAGDHDGLHVVVLAEDLDRALQDGLPAQVLVEFVAHAPGGGVACRRTPRRDDDRDVHARRYADMGDRTFRHVPRSE